MDHKRRIRLTYEEKERYLPVSAFAGYEDGTFLTAFDSFSGVRFTLRAFESQLHEAANWDYAQKPLFTASLSDGHWQSFSYKDNLIDKFASQRPRTPLNKSNLVSNVKNSQLSAEPTAYHAQPLFELLTAFD